jgi:hypothetical protein
MFGWLEGGALRRLRAVFADAASMGSRELAPSFPGALPPQKESKKVLTLRGEIQYQRDRLQNRQRTFPGRFFVCEDPGEPKKTNMTG